MRVIQQGIIPHGTFRIRFLILILFLLFLLSSGTACASPENPEIVPVTKPDSGDSTELTESTESESMKQTLENPKNSEKSRDSDMPESSRTPDNPDKTKNPENPGITEIPESVLIEDVPYYSQKNILPTGCEIISAKMLLEYYSRQETEIEDMLSVISCQSFQWEHGRLYASHPEDAFIGNPYSESGYGCFAPVIVRMLNHLLPDSYRAVDISGTELQELAETYLPQGTPVLVWATIGMWNASPTSSWYLYNSRGYATDHQFQWLANEHCMVLIGYDTDYYYFQDPYESNGTMKFRKDISEKRYEEIGSYSVVVTEK